MAKETGKLRVGVFDFTGCEGCELNHLNFENQLPAILGHVEFVEWREAMDSRADELDVAFVEGSLSTPDCIQRIHAVRRKAKVLVAVGACAVQGGVNGLKNTHPIEQVREEVYGEDKYLFPTLPALAVSSVVKVDYEVRGCPMTQEEFLKVFISLVMGKLPSQPDHAVCVDCKLRENECVYDKGLICLGPVSRAGCGAICPAFGQYCTGCRGLVSEANLPAMQEILVAHGLSAGEAWKRLQLFNANQVEGVQQ